MRSVGMLRSYWTPGPRLDCGGHAAPRRRPRPALRARALVRRAGRARRDLRCRRRAHRRAHLHRRAGRGLQGLQHARRPRPEAARAGRHRAGGDHRARLAGGEAARGRPRHRAGACTARPTSWPPPRRCSRAWAWAGTPSPRWATTGPTCRCCGAPAFACAPAGAHAEVRDIADHVTRAPGGHGAARECCDLLLTAAGRYVDLLQGHLTTLDGGGP
jgi:hypothetical protein